jgi:signal transduction histidine kinase
MRLSAKSACDVMNLLVCYFYTYCFFSFTYLPIKDNDNAISYGMILLQNITTRKQAEAEREKLIVELENKNAELERFTYTVSHDLKSPLITIRGYLGFLEKDALAGNIERMKSDQARIVEATNRMQRLLSELLELSRIGRLVNPSRPVLFREIVNEAINVISGQLRERGVIIKIADNLPEVYGDRARLVEVMQNLLDNACKFICNQIEPCVEIGQYGIDEEGNPILFVRDNGIGIESQYHDKIFGLFNKLDAHTEGTGVGLALVKRIIEVHGGRIWVESDTGMGATFLFTLPTLSGSSTSGIRS